MAENVISAGWPTLTLRRVGLGDVRAVTSSEARSVRTTKPVVDDEVAAVEAALEAALDAALEDAFEEPVESQTVSPTAAATESTVPATPRPAPPRPAPSGGWSATRRPTRRRPLGDRSRRRRQRVRLAVTCCWASWNFADASCWADCDTDWASLSADCACCCLACVMAVGLPPATAAATSCACCSASRACCAFASASAVTAFETVSRADWTDSRSRSAMSGLAGVRLRELGLRRRELSLGRGDRASADVGSMVARTSPLTREPGLHVQGGQRPGAGELDVGRLRRRGVAAGRDGRGDGPAGDGSRTRRRGLRVAGLPTERYAPTPAPTTARARTPLTTKVRRLIQHPPRSCRGMGASADRRRPSLPQRWGCHLTGTWVRHGCRP